MRLPSFFSLFKSSKSKKPKGGYSRLLDGDAVADDKALSGPMQYGGDVTFDAAEAFADESPLEGFDIRHVGAKPSGR